MPKSAEETTAWVAARISDMDDVKEAVVTSPNTIQITRKNSPAFVAGVISAAKVTSGIIDSLLDKHPSVEMVVNVPKESLWTGGAISAAASRGASFGGIGDLMSIIAGKTEDVGKYVRKEYAFVERGLRQHSRVQGVEREFDRVYVVNRNGLPSLRFVMLNEYELTGDNVRTARDRYGAFEIVLLNNPNGRPTQGALQVAKEIKVSVMKWPEFYGRLNRR